MKKVCKKCDGTGKVLKHITWGGGTYGDKGYWYNVYMEDKCDCLKKRALATHLLSVFGVMVFGGIMIFVIIYFVFK